MLLRSEYMKSCNLFYAILFKKISHECDILVLIFFLQTFIQETLDTATLFYYMYNGQIEKYTQEVFNISHGDCYEHF